MKASDDFPLIYSTGAWRFAADDASNINVHHH
jgi:hypothetical protein